jgi:hypothetical protein
MIAFLLLVSLADAIVDLQCGTYAQTEQMMRICFELETQNGTFCVANTQGLSGDQRFAASATAADRSIVIEYAALANAAGMFGAKAQTCIDLWRRARCAIAFPLSSDAVICGATCDRLTRAACNDKFFHLDACQFPDTRAGCVDISTETSCVISKASIPDQPTARPPRRSPRSAAAALSVPILLLTATSMWFT